MKLIKLNAIDSTNEYIKINKSIFDKEMVCIYTFNQTMGKGQRGRNWESEPYKNLCVSFYSLLSKKASKDIFFKLNMIVSLKMIRILKKYSIPKLSIKWPNDILSENKKIAGILIETSLKNGRLNDFIIGIGLNVNQISEKSSKVTVKFVGSFSSMIEMMIRKPLENFIESLKNKIEEISL